MSILKKIALWISILLLILVAQGLFLIYIYEDDIKQLAVNKINEQLATKVNIDQIELSLLSHFPFASLKFEGVRSSDSLNKENELLKAEEISMLFNVWELYLKNYRIQKLVINNAELNIQIAKNGQDNYHFWKSKKGPSSNFELNIEHIELNNVRINYADKRLNQFYSLIARNAALKGRFTESKFNMNVSGDFLINYALIKNINYLSNKNLTANFNLDIDQEKSLYTFRNGRVKMAEMAIDINGSIQNKVAGILFNLDISGKEVTVQSFISLLPGKYSRYFYDYSSTGDFFFNISLKGLLDNIHNPALSATVKIKNGQIKIKKYDKILSDIELDLSYTNGNKQNLESSLLSIKSVSGTLEGKPFKGSFTYFNFNEPYINLDISTELRLVDLAALLPLEKLKNIQGDVKIDATFKGLLADFKNKNTIRNVETSGQIQIFNANFSVEKSELTFRDFTGDFSFINKDLRINNFSGKISESDFQLSGYFRNLIAWALLPEQELEIDAQLTAQKLNLEELLAVTASGNSNVEQYSFKINPLFSGKFKVNIGTLRFNKFNANKLNGIIIIRDQILRSEFLSFEGMDGSIYTKFSVDASMKNNIGINADLNLRGVNITKLFNDCGNFGQNILVSDNLKGKLTASINFSSLWNKNLTIEPDKLYAKANLLIENGELINFEPLMALAKYLDINELRNLRFSDLQNQIEIREQTIYIPQMEIKNNALNLTLSGTHTFDNRIDYRISLLLNELLSKKSKKIRNNEFGPIEDDGSGKTILPLKMTGTVSNPIISLDKSIVKQNIVKGLKQEGITIKEILKQEVGSWKNKEKLVEQPDNQNSSEWENDIPVQKTTKPADSDPVTPKKEVPKEKKSALQKLKDKINVPIEEE